MPPDDPTSSAPIDGTATPSPDLTPTPFPDATVVANDGDLETGREHFFETCAGCHGIRGEGVPSLGLPLVSSPLVLYASDADLLAFIRAGRASDHPDNVTGVAMPPSGGRPDWSDADLLSVVAYVRWLRDNAVPPSASP